MTIPSTMISRKIYNKKLGKDTIMFINNKYLPEADVLKLGVNTTRTQSAPVSQSRVGGLHLRGGYPDRPTGLGMVLRGSPHPEFRSCGEELLRRHRQPELRRRHRGGLLPQVRRQCEEQPGLRRAPDPTGTHLNSMDYNADRDEVVFNSRQYSEFYVVDHNTTTAEAKGKKGDFLYRFGSPYNYASDDQLGAGKGKAKFPSYLSAELHPDLGRAQHPLDPQRAARRRPFPHLRQRRRSCHGRILFRDPGDQRPGRLREVCEGTHRRLWRTYVPERQYRFCPALGMAGQTAMKVSKQIVWGYSAYDAARSTAQYISGCERLPNGNTQITSGMHGHMFEVTSAGDLVWEYASPIMCGNYVTDTLGLDIEWHAPHRRSGNGDQLGVQVSPLCAGLPRPGGQAAVSQGTFTKPATYTGFGFGTGGTSGRWRRWGATGAGGGAAGGY